MSDVIDWSKAPEGATQYVINSVGPWEKTEDGKLYYWYKGDWLKLPWRGDDSYSGLKIVKRQQPTHWSGEGLPPVGTVCEYNLMAGPWYRCEVRYILDNDKDPDADGWTAVIWCPHLEKEQIARYGNIGFRPIRTPEQIAADERETAIDQMVSDTQAAHGWTEAFGMLHDKGYRKP